MSNMYALLPEDSNLCPNTSMRNVGTTEAANMCMGRQSMLLFQLTNKAIKNV